MMTKKILIVLITFMACSFLAKAQQQASEFEMIKSIFETEKRGYFEQYMGLTKEEELIFWPIYEDYEIERSSYSRKRLDALNFFVNNYETMTDSQAKDFMDNVFTFQKKDLKLLKKYYGMLSGKINEKSAVRFIQIEEYINTKIKLAILEVLPYIKG